MQKRSWFWLTLLFSLSVSFSIYAAPSHIITTDWQVELLSYLTNPNIAYILLLAGIYGLFFEIANPGLILPGVAGLFCLLFALYAFQLLPINYLGLTLLLAGMICLVVEVFVNSFGIFAVIGIIGFVMGSMMLLKPNQLGYEIALSLIGTMTIITIAFFGIVLYLAIGSFRKPIVTGREALMGSEGEVLEAHPHYILVRVKGEIWNAQCTSPLKIGDKIRVINISNLLLTVEFLEK